jgi:hypothetical protein
MEGYMQKTVKIGETEIMMRSSAATAIRYRNVFHEDIMQELMGFDPGKMDAAVIEKIQKLGYIMARSAERADMTRLTEDDYMVWLDHFETIDLAQASKEILMLYLGNKLSSSELKKTEGTADPEK